MCINIYPKKADLVELPISCVVHKTAVLQIKATGASKGHLLIVLVRPVMSVFLNTHTHTQVGERQRLSMVRISRVHLNVLLFGSVQNNQV